MSSCVAGEWKSLKVTKSELNLRITLLCGQSFRWREVGPNTWAGVINNSIVTLKQDDTPDHIQYQFYTPTISSPATTAVPPIPITIPAPSSMSSPSTPLPLHLPLSLPLSLVMPLPPSEEDVLKDYFQLSHSLAALYPVWAAAGNSLNDHFKISAAAMTGVRILRQPPLECLYSFICSSNNNISRITKMVESLCVTYGTFLGEVGGHRFYTFPTLSQLSSVDEETLRNLGFGYRAKYIVNTTAQLRAFEEGWLDKLRTSSREDAQKNLTTLMGVGRKVADCVSLFSLDKLDVVPIDTHIFALAQRHMPALKGKSLTPALYDQIGKFFVQRFGTLAGWAHTVLFAGDLSKFQNEVADANKVSKQENDKKKQEGVEDEKENATNGSKRKVSKKGKGKRKTKKNKY